MLCINPTDYGHGPVACGQCTNCRINHKLRWMGRMALEQRYGFPGCPGTFITLTYSDEHLPPSGSLEPQDLKVFIQALKRRLGPQERYFAVGEYGSLNLRPHFHVIHFGASASDGWSKLYADIWQKGFVQSGSAEMAAHDYVGGYITKKLDGKHQQRIADLGLKKEYFSSSRRPPLGDTGLTAIAAMFNTDQGARLIATCGFPKGFRLNGRYYPFFQRDRFQVIERSGHLPEPEEHLAHHSQDVLWTIEEYELYRQAEAHNWPPAKLATRLNQLKERTDAEKIARETERARARATKFRRQAAKRAYQKTLD